MRFHFVASFDCQSDHVVRYRNEMVAEMEQGINSRKSISILRFDNVTRFEHCSLGHRAQFYLPYISWHAGSQTLGEEYCDIMQYAASTKKPPSARVSTSSLDRSLTRYLIGIYLPIEAGFATIAPHLCPLSTFAILFLSSSSIACSSRI